MVAIGVGLLSVAVAVQHFPHPNATQLELSTILCEVRDEAYAAVVEALRNSLPGCLIPFFEFNFGIKSAITRWDVAKNMAGAGDDCLNLSKRDSFFALVVAHQWTTLPSTLLAKFSSLRINSRATASAIPLLLT